jgi:RND family efflux transporter MFP subunit
MKRRLPWILAVLVVLGVGLWFGRQRLAPPVVELITPTRGVALDAVYATGTVEPSLEIRIAPRTPGRIVELLVDEGDVVRRGQLLARLDDADLRASVAELEARARYARGQFERTRELRNQALVAADALDRARTDLEAAQAALRRARETSAQMRLTAPSSGTIIRRDAEVGEYAAVNTPLFYLAGPEPLRISADVDEEDVPRVRVGQRVLIRSDAFPDRGFEGRVSEITPRGDTVTRSYRVRIAFAGDAPLPIGMSTETNIVIEQRDDALLLPVSALAGDAAWIYSQGRVSRRTLRLGVRAPERVEVLEGLAADDRVVDAPPASLREGQRVRLRGPQPATPEAPAPQP